MASVFEKVARFLREYRDIYGDDVFVDGDRIRQLTGSTDIPVHLPDETGPNAEVAEKPATPLWRFQEEIKDCTRCPLGHTRTRFVFGDGQENAGIMFIGEAPGREEDRTGIPFVGRAGKLLNNLLANIKIDRQQVFIANILKCRPPENRDPQPGEVQQCLPYLHKQIEMIQPKLIVALGRIAAQNLLNKTQSLKQMRERLWQYRGVNMIVTYHPAAILRNMGLLKVANEDFKFILKTYLDSTKSAR